MLKGDFNTIHDAHSDIIQSFKTSKTIKTIKNENNISFKKYLTNQQNENNNKWNNQKSTNKKNYYLNNSHILLEYYNNTKQNSDTDKFQIVNFMNNNNKNNNLNNIFNQYKKNIDNRHSGLNLNIFNKDPYSFCNKCGNTTDLLINESESSVECMACGCTNYSPTLQSLPSYKMTRTTRPTMTVYKRINHFNDWISQFQAKESVAVPNKIYKNILIELKKHKQIKKITGSRLRTILRKLGYNKYYEHIPRIIHKIQGTPPPTINRETEEKMRIMFKMIQDPFTKFSPKNRKNFLSYSFVLRKFVGLLNLNHLKKSFPLLKSRSKLYSQDEIWRKICDNLNWRFEPSL